MQLSSELLFLSGEPAMLVKHDRIIHSNAAAEELLGCDCTGRSLKAVLGTELAEAQGSLFMCSVPADGRTLNARVMKSDGVAVIFLSRPEYPDNFIGDSAIYFMRNKLMNTSFALDMLRLRAEAAQDEFAIRQLSVLIKSSFSSRRIISNISFLHSLKNKTLVPSFVGFELRALVSQLLDKIVSLRPGTDIRLLDGDTIELVADPVMVVNMLTNLISNCMVHAKGLSCISIGLFSTAEVACITVSDDGCGIASGRLYTVLEQYKHLSDHDGSWNGFGLGLTVVRELCTIHKGSLLLESREGLGTAVRLTLSRGSSPSLGDSGGILPITSEEVMLQLADALPPESFLSLFSP